jgi:hypothetical protein
MDLSRAQWRKASRSNSNGGACVEAASLPGVIAVRDSKDPHGPVLTMPPAAWRGFIADVRAGRHDLT